MEKPKRRVGRPPIDPDDRMVRVSLALPSKRYDQLCADAKQQRMSLTDMMRRLLARRPS